MVKEVLKAPFPWFGGKSVVADIVWEAFGNVRNYVEPFFGSGACLLARPTPFEGTETVNDADGMIANFWRAISCDPDAVAKYADWPVSECDLHARHLWLVTHGRPAVERLKSDPDYYDPKIAGWWVWGICQWIGSGWCENSLYKKRPDLGSGKGVHRPSQKLPHLGDAGRGVHRPSQQLPHLGDAGRGVHRPSQQLPHLGSAGMGVHDYFQYLSARLRRVRVCCGDWSRICGPTPTVKQGVTGMFLDPPYLQTERTGNLYAVETNVSGDVRKWCLEHGNDNRLRIALCGYLGEGHEELENHGWRTVAWKARGGYGSQGDKDGRDNAARERIWFSPHCLGQKDLFDFCDQI